MEWPIFKNKSELSNSKWGNYFINLYGEIPNSGYPIDMSKFWLLYTDLLKESNINIKDKCVVNGSYKCSSICPTNEGQIYSDMSGAWIYSDDMENTIWIYHKGPYTSLPNNTNVEVTHVTGGYPGEKEVEEIGSWMYYAPGSGIYFNLGNTISFKYHSDSVKYFLKKKMPCPIYNICKEYFSDVFTIAKKQGYDSIQYLHHEDMKCGNSAIEIVDLHGVGAYPCGNKTKFNITSGWKGENICKCDNKKQSMNCIVNNNIIGGLKIKHGPWYDIFLYIYHHKIWILFLSLHYMGLFFLLVLFIVLLFKYRKKLTKFFINI